MADDPSPGHKDGLPYPGDCEFTAFLRHKAESRTTTIPRSEQWQRCLDRAKAVKLLLLDVDGVLTDGSITYSENGDEIKTFNARDGFGINMVRTIGVEVGIITARKSLALERRVKDLSLSLVFQGVRYKVRSFHEIIEQLQIKPWEAAYVGDDWLDLPLLKLVGLAVAVNDALPEVRELAHFVTANPGGRGAVREVCDLIIAAKGQRQALLTKYMDRQ